MNSIKKHSVYIFLTILLLISLIFNMNYYKNSNKNIAFIDGEPVLDKRTLEGNLVKKYGEIEITDSINESLRSMNYDKAPTEDNLKDINAKFKELTEKNDSKKRLTEIYYYYNLYISKFKSFKDIENYMSLKDDKNIYKIQAFDTVDHNLAVDVENNLKDGLSIEEVENKYEIEFRSDLFTMLPDALSEENEEIKVSKNEVLHLMDDEGMLIMFIEDIINTDKLEDLSTAQINDVYDYIFKKNFYVLKPKINNELKKEHEINIDGI